MEEALLAPEHGELADWPLPILLAHLAADPAVSTLVVDEKHQLVLRDGDLVAAWTEGLDEQGTAEDRIARAMKAPAEATFIVHRVDLLHAAADVECPGLRAILVAARAWDDQERIDAEIEAMVGDASLCLEEGAALDDFAFDDDEQEVVAHLETPGVAEYARLCERVDPEVARRVVWALAVTQHLSSVPSTLLLAAEDHAAANEALDSGDLETANARASRAAECDPRPAYRALQAYVHGLRGTVAELPIAIALLDRAIADEPERARGYAFRAKLRERAGQTALATQDWAKARALDENDVLSARDAPTLPPPPPSAPPQKRGLIASLRALVTGRNK